MLIIILYLTKYLFSSPTNKINLSEDIRLDNMAIEDNENNNISIENSFHSIKDSKIEFSNDISSQEEPISDIDINNLDINLTNESQKSTNDVLEDIDVDDIDIDIH